MSFTQDNDLFDFHRHKYQYQITPYFDTIYYDDDSPFPDHFKYNQSAGSSIKCVQFDQSATPSIECIKSGESAMPYIECIESCQSAVPTIECIQSCQSAVTSVEFIQSCQSAVPFLEYIESCQSAVSSVECTEPDQSAVPSIECIQSFESGMPSAECLEPSQSAVPSIECIGSGQSVGTSIKCIESMVTSVECLENGKSMVTFILSDIIERVIDQSSTLHNFQSSQSTDLVKKSMSNISDVNFSEARSQCHDYEICVLADTRSYDGYVVPKVTRSKPMYDVTFQKDKAYKRKPVHYLVDYYETFVNHCNTKYDNDPLKT